MGRASWAVLATSARPSERAEKGMSGGMVVYRHPLAVSSPGSTGVPLDSTNMGAWHGFGWLAVEWKFGAAQ